MLSSTFSPGSIRRLQPVFQAKAREVCELFDRAIAISGYENVGAIDCTDTFSKATLDIMSLTTLGVGLSHMASIGSAETLQARGELAKSPYTFHEAYSTIFGPDTIGKLLMFGNMFLPTRWLPLEANHRFKFATTWLHDTLSRLVHQRFRDVKVTSSEGKYSAKGSQDILSFIVEESMPGGVASGITKDLVKGHDCQAKLRDEICQLTNRVPSPGFSDLDNLPYLNQFVKEVLRVYPPASIIYRQANEGIIIDGVEVPKDTCFEVVAAVTSMNPYIWGENAEMFDPSRWDCLTEVQASPYAFAAFSNGPRICIGRQFALYEIKTILVEIIRSFEVLDDMEPFTIENPGLTLRPHGMKVRFRRTD
ncbi:hypothetical protein TruAng_004673 [Truncatella angustata]|nr:hypothetical protein TruAng_004673 [Truncatella angustata]